MGVNAISADSDLGPHGTTALKTWSGHAYPSKLGELAMAKPGKLLFMKTWKTQSSGQAFTNEFRHKTSL